MAKKQNYFIGKGVYTFEGKDYGYGELLPDAVPQETINSMRDKGKVGDSPAQINVVSSDESESLKAQLANATKSAEELHVALEQAQGMVAERDADLATAQATIAELTAQLTTPGAAPAAETKASKK